MPYEPEDIEMSVISGRVQGRPTLFGRLAHASALTGPG